jgi:anti-sigma-K factor RskA
MSGPGHEAIRADIAPYLLGALDADASRALERHLAGCSECSEELLWLRPAAQLLPETVEPREPPAGMREAILERVRTEAAAARSRPDREARGPLLRRWRPLAAVTVLALIVAAAGGYALRGGSGDGGPDMIASGGHPPGMTAALYRNGDTGMLQLAHVHRMPRDMVLEAWVRRGGRVAPVRGLFMPDRRGVATATIGDLGGVETVMVSLEPRGGSRSPTSAPMIVLSAGG